MAKADYGIDAPGSVQRLAIMGVLLLATRAGIAFVDLPALRGVVAACTAAGVTMLAVSAFMLISSKFLKFGLRNRLVASLRLAGGERVLDVGCGRGLALIGAAKKLTTGHATGVDLWSAEDLSDNRPEATLANAAAEGVAER